MASRKEERALGDQSRPGDVILPAYTSGRDTLFDVTVINAMRQDLLARCAKEPKVAVGHAFSTKWSKYGEKCLQEGFCFVPLPVDSLGAFHDRAIQEIKKLGSILARNTGEEDSVAIRHFFQRLSVMLAKGNSAIILTRMPLNDVAPPHIDGQF